MPDTPTQAAPLRFDAAGNHLQEHGKPVASDYTSVTRKYGVAPGLQVLTRLAARKATPPAVVLYSADLPFVLDWRLSAGAARELAANLVRAAETCERLGALRKNIVQHEPPREAR